MNRLKKSTLSSVMLVFANLFLVFIGVFRIRYINMYYGTEFNGLYQFALQFVRYVEMADIGYTAIFISLLYEAISKSDDKRITNLIKSCNYWQIQFTKIMLVSLGLIILIIILLIRDQDFSSLSIAFVLFVTAIPVLLNHLVTSRFAYLAATQRQYKCLAPLMIGKGIIFIISIFIMKYVPSFVFLVSESMFQIFLLIIFLNIANKENKRVCIKDYEYKLVHIEFPRAMIGVKVADLINKNTDNILIGTLKGISSVGIVAPYFYIMSSLDNVFWSFGNVIKTTLGDMLYHKVPYFKDYFIAFVKLLFYIATFLSLLVFIGADSFISIFYYPNGGFNLFYGLALSISLILFLQISFSYLKIIVEIKLLWKYMFKVYLAEAILNVFLTIVFLRYTNVTGAYWATIISFLLINVPISLFVVCRELEIDFLLFVKNQLKYGIFYFLLLIISEKSRLLLTNIISLKDWFLVMIAIGVILCVILLLFMLIFDMKVIQIIKDTLKNLLPRSEKK